MSDKDREALLPCPLCGGKATVMRWEMWRVECAWTGGCKARTTECDTEAEAIALWHRRDHYAPKLTEKGEVGTLTLHLRIGPEGVWIEQFVLETGSELRNALHLSAVICALGTAGLRFKEEA